MGGSVTEKELKKYLRQCQGQTEEQIATIERNATEADLEVLRKGMRSFLEMSGGKMPNEWVQEFQQQQAAAREKAMRESRQKAREIRAKKKSGFALGLGFPLFLALLLMLLKWIFG